MRRALSVVAATMFAVGGLAGTSASAATLPLCQDGDGYIPGETCDAGVIATPDCPDGYATIDYGVDPDSVEGDVVDVTWTGLPGGDVAVADVPLTGTLTWPTGVTTDATLVFGTTPATAVLAEYPCADDTDGGVLADDDDEAASRSTTRTAVAARGESGVLAQTGMTGLPIALGGGVLIAGGAAAVLLARRGRQAGATE